MLVSYQVENLHDCQTEIDLLLIDHWLEVSLNQTEVPLDPDWDFYFHMQDSGQLHIVTMRCAGELVGYHVTFVRPHPHYKTTLHGFGDVYYLNPDYRKGGHGIKLFREVDRTLKARGVVKVFSATKIHNDLDISVIFERLGWTFIEKVYSKLL